MITGFEPSTVLPSDLSEQTESVAIIHAGRILTEVFVQKLATEGANGVGALKRRWRSSHRFRRMKSGAGIRLCPSRCGD